VDDVSSTERGIVEATSLGSALFTADYGIKYAYLAGAMYKGIASARLVIELGKAGLMGYLGTGGLKLEEIESAIAQIRSELGTRHSYGMNLLCNLERPEIEDQTVDLYLRHGIRYIEAAAFMRTTPALVRYRLKGLRAEGSTIARGHRVLAKVSRPEVAAMFMQPAAPAIVSALLASGRISKAEAQLAARVPIADEVCVESDSAGHTDRGVATALFPSMLALRDEMMKRHAYDRPIHLGAAGGIGTPHAAAAVFVMGADFVLTGSINQCTVEAGTSASVKDLLQQINVQDTTLAPAGDMFELGAKAQVVRRGVLFPARANKLYELFQRYESLDEIDAKSRAQIEEKYFRRTFEEVWDEARKYYLTKDPDKLAELEKNPKRKMASVFKWYFAYSTLVALQGDEERRVDYQIHCGPAMGAFNQWVAGSELENWRNRRVADIAERIMTGTAHHLSRRFARMCA
jgi:trans-AT polyketide synthase, acyltransferase and oxidoreductase domains